MRSVECIWHRVTVTHSYTNNICASVKAFTERGTQKLTTFPYRQVYETETNKRKSVGISPIYAY